MRPKLQTSWNLRRRRRYCGGCSAENVEADHRCAQTELITPPPVLSDPDPGAGDIAEAVNDYVDHTYMPHKDEEVI